MGVESETHHFAHTISSYMHDATLIKKVCSRIEKLIIFLFAVGRSSIRPCISKPILRKIFYSVSLRDLNIISLLPFLSGDSFNVAYCL